ncbi:MAG: hypothetical protein PHC56_01725 [Herbinix sp.]|nr:hypothetical protein [Herbinix sp.]
MRKRIKSILSIVLVITMTACSKGKSSQINVEAEYQKNIARINRYESNIPSNYKLIDYKDRALKFDELVFDYNSDGMYLPLIWEDSTYSSFGIPAYVGDGRMYQDGAQEAVTGIAAVLSATLLGVDKSNQSGINYIEQLTAFYSEDEEIVLNNPMGSSATTSMWYLIYPAILFTQVSIHYPDETKLREQALSNIESWYKAYQVMYESNTFDYTGFNFITNKPYKNGIWTEPDCIAGIALLLYYGYELTGDEEYLNAIENGLEYLTDYFGSPLYEALLYFAPYLAAMSNAKYETNFNVEDIMNDVLNGSSIPRGGWGSITGTWGDYSMNGLMGSTSDGAGYAFAMNTFVAAYAMSPVVKYDSRYASSLGKWYLNLVSNSRYYFADQTNKENQSASRNEYDSDFAKSTGYVVPYEGIRKSQNSKTPWFGGDPTVYGWADTDFSLYSGAHIGIMASIIEETNVKAILKINLNTADLFSQEYNTYLMYNPYEKEKTVLYHKAREDAVDLYNSVTKEMIASNVTDKTKIKIPAQGSVVVVELPTRTNIEHIGRAYVANGKIVAADAVSVKVNNYSNNDTVSGEFQLTLTCISSIPEDSAKEIIVSINDEIKVFNDINNITFSTEELGTGSTTFKIEVTMNSGLTDKTDIRLSLQ